MLRFAFTLFFYVIVGRWLYAEVNILCPRIVPGIDQLLASVEIPTHDNWSQEGIKQAFQSADSVIRRISFDVSESRQRRPEENNSAAEGKRDSFNDARDMIKQTPQMIRDLGKKLNGSET